MLLYYPFWMFMGFTLPFYIIFGTNLLTGGPARIAVFFAYFSISKKRNIKRTPNGMKPSEGDFWNERDPENLECKSRSLPGGQETGGRAHPLWAPPLSCGLLEWPPTYFFLLYIPTYPENIQGANEKQFPPP